MELCSDAPVARTIPGIRAEADTMGLKAVQHDGLLSRTDRTWKSVHQMSEQPAIEDCSVENRDEENVDIASRCGDYDRDGCGGNDGDECPSGDASYHREF